MSKRKKTDDQEKSGLNPWVVGATTAVGTVAAGYALSRAGFGRLAGRFFG